MNKTLTLTLLWLAAACAQAQPSPPPVRLAIYGLVHDHVSGFLPILLKRHDVQLAGIIEPDRTVVARYQKRFGLDSSLFFPSLDALLAQTRVQAVATFTTTYDHRRVVEECAPLGIDVMMEKPMAVNLEDARAIAAAAKKGEFQVVVNYETTWYPSNQRAYELVEREHAVGDLRKIVVHDGHQGPKAIGCAPEFLRWLTDPVLNGGGAEMDFGCYGAGLITWLMGGQRPTSVFAVAQHFQPEAYPKVEDESTIVLTYPRAQGIIQASWNWPYSRKDMEIYGQRASLMVPNRDSLRFRKGKAAETDLPAPALAAPETDSISYLAAVVRKEISPSGLSSVEVNLVVNEILDAARESARTGRRVDLPSDPSP